MCDNNFFLNWHLGIKKSEMKYVISWFWNLWKIAYTAINGLEGEDILVHLRIKYNRQQTWNLNHRPLLLLIQQRKAFQKQTQFKEGLQKCNNTSKSDSKDHIYKNKLKFLDEFTTVKMRHFRR